MTIWSGALLSLGRAQDLLNAVSLGLLTCQQRGLTHQAALSMLKGKNSKEEAYTKDTGQVSIVVLTIIEEASHSLGQILLVIGVRDEAFLGATDTFVTKQGVGGEVVEDLDKDILRDAGQCVPLVGGLLHFISVQYDESFLSNEITEEENNPTKIHQ